MSQLLCKVITYWHNLSSPKPTCQPVMLRLEVRHLQVALHRQARLLLHQHTRAQKQWRNGWWMQIWCSFGGSVRSMVWSEPGGYGEETMISCRLVTLYTFLVVFISESLLDDSFFLPVSCWCSRQDRWSGLRSRWLWQILQPYISAFLNHTSCRIDYENSRI